MLLGYLILFLVWVPFMIDSVSSDLGWNPNYNREGPMFKCLVATDISIEQRQMVEETLPKC